MTNYLDTLAKNYNFVETQQDLWNKSSKGSNFNNLWKKVISRRNILFAHKRLSTNSGRNTPGPDGKIYDDIKFLDDDTLIRETKRRLRGEVRPESRSVLIPKTSGSGSRTIKIGNIYDRLAQYAVLNILEPILENQFQPFSFAYRRNRDALDCIQTIFNNVAKVQNGFLWHADLTSYFDLVNLDLVCNKLRTNFKIKDSQLLGRIKGLMMPIEDGKPYKLGLAQGSILGPVLANVLLDDLDRSINTRNQFIKYSSENRKQPWGYYNDTSKRKIREKGLEAYENWRKGRLAVKIIRYADDFVLVSNNQTDIFEAVDLVKDWVKKMDLKLNEEKCSLTKLNNPQDLKIDFLGYSLNRKERNQGKWTFGPKNASKTWNECRRRIRSIMYKEDAEKLAVPILLGYMNYYQLTTSMGWFIERCNKMFYKWSRTSRDSMSNHKPKNFRKIPGHDQYMWGSTKIDLWEFRKRTKADWSRRTSTRSKNMGWNPNENVLGSQYALVEELMAYSGTKLKDNLSSWRVFVPGLVYTQKFEPLTGRPLSDFAPWELTVHHVRPRKFGGTNDFKNLRLILVDSHVLIHNFTIDRANHFENKWGSLNWKAMTWLMARAQDGKLWDEKDKLSKKN